MNSSWIKYLVCFLLFWPADSWAHALSHTYYPLGPVPILLTVEWWPFSFLIPVTIAIETLVLCAWTRRLGLYGSLCRASVLYVLARIAETALLFTLQSIPMFQNAGWRSNAEDFIPLVLFVTTGTLTAVLVGLPLYRRTGYKASLVVPAVCSASLAGYFSALACSLMLAWIRGY
jgi:hypothetical protein